MEGEGERWKALRRGLGRKGVRERVSGELGEESGGGGTDIRQTESLDERSSGSWPLGPVSYFQRNLGENMGFF